MKYGIRSDTGDTAAGGIMLPREPVHEMRAGLVSGVYFKSSSE